MFQATEESSNSSSEESSIDDDCSVSTYRSALEVKEGVSDSDERELRENLIKHEEKDVRKAKCMVAFAFLVCAFAVCFSVFIFAKKGDEKSFELEVSLLFLNANP